MDGKAYYVLIWGRIMSQTDNSVIQIFLPIINAGLVADGFDDVIVTQSNQPTMQGISTDPTVYFFKLANRRYGFLGRYDKWSTVSSTLVHTEVQYIESTFQVSALVLQNPSTPSQYTASDLVNEVAAIMQSDSTLSTLNSNGIGILRVTDLTNPYFFDDRDNFEASPSFDFTLVYQNDRVSVDPIITTFNSNIIGV